MHLSPNMRRRTHEKCQQVCDCRAKDANRTTPARISNSNALNSIEFSAENEWVRGCQFFFEVELIPVAISAAGKMLLLLKTPMSNWNYEENGLLSSCPKSFDCLSLVVCRSRPPLPRARMIAAARPWAQTSWLKNSNTLHIEARLRWLGADREQIDVQIGSKQLLQRELFNRQKFGRLLPQIPLCFSF